MRGRPRAIAWSALVAGLAVGPPAAVAQEPDLTPTGQVRPPGLATPIGNERLSDERRITRWAHAATRAKVRERPTINAKTVTRLRFQTEDGPPEVYLVLQGYRDTKGRTWLRIRVPKRPNGQTGWVVEDHLGELQLVRTKLRINRKTFKATLFRDGNEIFSAPIGIGKRTTPTPSGKYWIRERLRNLEGSPIYGPWALGTAAYSRLSDWPRGGVVGIHGTNEPGLLPGRVSHGCVRMTNANVSELARLMPIGTPVEIL